MKNVTVEAKLALVNNNKYLIISLDSIVKRIMIKSHN